MPKPKSYDSEQVQSAIKTYFYSVCFGDVKRLKMTQICQYLRDNGFPDVNDRKLNRDPDIRSLLTNLIENSEDIDYKTIISYTPLNADEFLKTNNSIEKLRSALTILDNYYDNLCASILKKYEEFQSASFQFADQMKELNNLSEDLKKEKKENSLLKGIIRDIENENRRYKAFINDTVLPEIANDILRRDRVLHNGSSVISTQGYSNMVIDDDSCLKDELNKIKKQESKFKNPIVSRLYDSVNEDE